MDTELTNTRWGFITFRAHVSEPQLFEDYLNIFLPILNNFEKYAYSIEEDNSPNRHIHAIVSLTPTIKDKSKLDQKFTNKFIKDFKKSLGIKQTAWEHAYDSKYLPDTLEDVMKVLGYVLKDDKVIRRRVKNITTNQITQAIKYHVSTARIESSVVQNDIKIINNKNFHISCEHFAKKNNMTVHDWDLIPRMTHQRHSFQINAKDMKKYESELRFMNSEYDEKSEHLDEILSFREKQQDKEDLWTHNSALMKIIRDNGLETEIPSWVINKYTN